MATKNEKRKDEIRDTIEALLGTRLEPRDNITAADVEAAKALEQELAQIEQSESNNRRRRMASPLVKSQQDEPTQGTIKDGRLSFAYDGQLYQDISADESFSSGESDLDFGRFMLCLASNEQRMRPENKAEALSIREAGDPTGGYMVADTMSSQVIDLVRNDLSLNSAGMRSIQMPTDRMDFVVVESDPTSLWTGELATIAESENTFGRKSLHARKVGCIVRVSNELLNDAPNAASIVRNSIVQSLAVKIDEAGLNGPTVSASDSANCPAGLGSITGVQTIDKSSGDATRDDVANAVKKVKEQNFMPNAMIWSPESEYQFGIDKDGENNYLGAQPEVYANLEKVTSNQANDTEFFVGQFDQYVMGIARNITVDVSREANTAFTSDATLFRVTARVDFLLQQPNAVCKVHSITYS